MTARDAVKVGLAASAGAFAGHALIGGRWGGVIGAGLAAFLAGGGTPAELAGAVTEIADRAAAMTERPALRLVPPAPVTSSGDATIIDMEPSQAPEGARP